MIDEPKPQNHKRHNFILDRAWQLAVFRNVAGVALAAGLLQMVFTYAISSQDPLDRRSGEQIGYLAFAANGWFLALMFFGLWAVMARVTHAVVGPAMVIKRAVDGLVVGEFDNRLTLRKRDYLKELAASVKVLHDQLKAREEISRELVETLARTIHQRQKRESRLGE